MISFNYNAETMNFKRFMQNLFGKESILGNLQVKSCFFRKKTFPRGNSSEGLLNRKILLRMGKKRPKLKTFFLIFSFK